MQVKLAGVLAVVLLALVAGGCGSATLSASKLRTQANAACQTTIRQVRAAERSAAQTGERPALARAAAAMDDGVARLQALQPPQRLAASYRRFVSWLAARRDAARALSKPGASIRTLSVRERRAVEAHHSPSDAYARQLGFSGCI